MAVGLLGVAMTLAVVGTVAARVWPRPSPRAARNGAAVVEEPPPGDPIPAGHVPILMYHYIRAGTDHKDVPGYQLSVTPENFSQQMRWAHAHGFHTISLGQLYTSVRDRQRLDRRTVVLTFDDGYSDFYTAALPVLHEYGYTATAYIITGFPGRSGYMTWDQIAVADRSGINIGAHTMTHRDLTAEVVGSAEAQIYGSKEVLETRLQHPVLDFCYPSGKFNSSVVNLVRAAGFRDATSTTFGVYESRESAFYWPRVRIEGNDTLASFSHKLAAGIATYQKYGDSPPPKLFPSPFSTFNPLTTTPAATPGPGGGSD